MFGWNTENRYIRTAKTNNLIYHNTLIDILI